MCPKQPRNYFREYLKNIAFANPNIYLDAIFDSLSNLFQNQRSNDLKTNNKTWILIWICHLVNKINHLFPITDLPFLWKHKFLYNFVSGVAIFIFPIQFMTEFKGITDKVYDFIFRKLETIITNWYSVNLWLYSQAV